MDNITINKETFKDAHNYVDDMSAVCNDGKAQIRELLNKLGGTSAAKPDGLVKRVDRGEIYWYVSRCGVAHHIDDGDNTDSTLYGNNNYFLEKSKAEAFAPKAMLLFKAARIAHEVNGGWEPNHTSEDAQNYYWCAQDGEDFKVYTTDLTLDGGYYFESRETAQSFRKHLGEDDFKKLMKGIY